MKQAMDYIVKSLLHAGISLEAAQELFLDAYVSAALQRAKGNISLAATDLNVHRNTLHGIIRRRPHVKSALGREYRKPRRSGAQLKAEFVQEQVARAKRKRG